MENTGIAADSYRILHLQYNQPWRSAKDLEQTFKQFETVVWYRGEQTAFSRVLQSYAVGPNGEGIGPYLDGGGKLFLESLSMVKAWVVDGSLSQAFIQKYLNCNGTLQRGQGPDSTGLWDLPGGGVLPCPGVADSLRNRGTLTGLRAFAAKDPSEILIVVPAHLMTQDNPFDFPVGMNVRQANNGRFIAVSFPLVSGSVPTATFPQRASVVLLKMLGLLGLAP